MKRDTLLMMIAVLAAVVSLLIYLEVASDRDIPPREFPKGSYTNTADNFGLELTPSVIKKTKQIISNVRMISSSFYKKRFLYDGISRYLVKKYHRTRIPALFGFIDEEEEGWLLGVLLQAAERVKSRLPEGIVLPDYYLFSSINNEGRIFAEYSDFVERSMISMVMRMLDWTGFLESLFFLKNKGIFCPALSIISHQL